MKIIVHKAAERGYANHGWLQAKHSFSFANYYNPDKIHFGVLRVLNDDIVAPGMGFGTHSHDNMEIITIPLSGDLEHKDSMGNSSVIHEGEIQVMSAGSGIMHSEFNTNKSKELNLFQIWLFPNKKNVEPRYQQMYLNGLIKKDELYQILSPNVNDQGVWIHQNAWFFMGDLSAGWSGVYEVKSDKNGVYVMIIEGELTIENTALNQRDAIGISDAQSIQIKSNTASRILIMDIPMQ